MSATSRAQRITPIVLLMLSAIGPFAIDAYMPVFPALALEFDSPESMIQLTLTACMIGLATGQLIGGPFADQVGRRKVMLLGTGAFALTSLLTAVAPTIETLIGARFIQGLAGGFALICANASGRDIYDGPQLVKFLARMSIGVGVAAIIAPNVGAAADRIFGWRFLFVALAIIGAAMFAICLAFYRETLPVERRSRGGLGATGRNLAVLAKDRIFVSAVVSASLISAGLFSILGPASFIYDAVYGVGPEQFGLVMGTNGFVLMVMSYIGGRVAAKWSPIIGLSVGVGVVILGAIGFIIGGLIDIPLGLALASQFTVTAGIAIGGPGNSALAIQGYPKFAGTASSILGVARSSGSAIAAPIVAAVGATTMLPAGVGAFITAVGAALAVVVIRATQARTRTPGDHPFKVFPVEFDDDAEALAAVASDGVETSLESASA
jgi:DHA1 family bicyclomycin/chloramphenicol resistance-like MFS transporter